MACSQILSFKNSDTFFVDIEYCVKVLKELETEDPLQSGSHRNVVRMHKEFALFCFLGWVVTHPSIYWQREEAAVDVHLKGLDQFVLLFVAITFVKVEVFVAFFLASDVSLPSHFFEDVFDVARWYQAVAESGVERDLFGLYLNIGAFLEAESLEWNGPSFRFFDKLVPYDVIFGRSRFCIFLKIIATKLEVTRRTRSFTEIK